MKSIIRQQLTLSNILFLTFGIVGWALLGSFLFAALTIYMLLVMVFDGLDEYNLRKFEDSTNEINALTTGENTSNNILLENKEKIRKAAKTSSKALFWQQFFFVGATALTSLIGLVNGIYAVVELVSNMSEAPIVLSIIWGVIALASFAVFVWGIMTTLKTVTTLTIPTIAKHKAISQTLLMFLDLIQNNESMQTDTTTKEIRNKYKAPTADPNTGGEMTSDSVVDMMKSMISPEQAEAVDKREAFAKSYCEKQGWSTNFADLTIEQIQEIRSQEEWKQI